MRSQAPIIIIAILAAAILAACTSSQPQNANQANQSAEASTNSNSVKNNVDELEMLIKLPFHPEEADWREEPMGKAANDRVPGPTDKKLVAILRFLKPDADNIVAQAEKRKAPTPASVNTENWFPGELVAQSQTSGDETLKGLTYAADDFYNPPYSDGKLTRIEGTDYFLLELFTK
jgi:hypothetical protein